MTRWVTWLAVLVLCACGGNGERSETAPEIAPEPAPPEEPPAPAPEPAPAEAAPPALGWDAIPAAPGAEARALNEAALARHEAGDFAEAVTGFTSAVEAAPGWDIYRYNLAAARARQGEHAEAAGHLEVLLARDLPSFGPRLEHDPDLETLRASADGARLRALAESLREPWRAALRTGLVTVARRAARAEGRPPELLRAGAYLHAARRFVPLGPREPAARGVLADPEHGLVVVSSWLPDRDSNGVRLRLRAFPALGGEPVVDVQPGVVFDLAFHAIAGGVRFRVQPDPMAIIWNQRWQEVTAPQSEPRESANRLAPDRHFVAAGRLRDAGYSYESWRVQHLGPFTFRRAAAAELVPPEGGAPIRVSMEHARATELHSLVRAPDGSAALFLSADATHHVIEHVDLGAGSVSEWARGEGRAFLRPHDGALYLQRGDVLVRLSSFDAPLASAEPVLEGVLLD